MGVAPPFTGTAVNVTSVPAQTGLAEAVIDTLAWSTGSTVIITVLEVAGFPVVQAALDVRMQVIASLFAGLKV